MDRTLRCPRINGRGSEKGPGWGVWGGDAEPLCALRRTGAMPRRDLAADLVTIAEVQVGAEPAVCDRGAGLQRSGEGNFPFGGFAARRQIRWGPPQAPKQCG